MLMPWLLLNTDNRVIFDNFIECGIQSIFNETIIVSMQLHAIDFQNADMQQ